MKIALVTPSYSRTPPDWCIPVLRGYAEALAARGVEVHVFPLAYPPEPSEYALGPVSVHAVGGPRLMSWARDPRVLARALRLIAAEHARGRFDALHAVFADECGPVALAAGRRLGVPVVATLAGGELVGLREIGYGCDLVWPRALAVRLTLRGARRLIVPSAYMDGLLRRRTARAAAIIPWGIDVDRFRPAPREASGAGVLCVAELRPVKDGALLVRAFARAAERHPGARLTLVGGGEAPDVLPGVRVARRARLAWDALPAVYAEAGVFAIASRHEAFCLAVLEAMACGLPVAGTAVGVLPEACAGDRPAGLCVQAGDEMALAAALEALLRDGALRERLGRNGRDLAAERYAWPAVAARCEALYREAVA